jgi:RNA polymerase-binding transcription factor DksA
MPASATEHRSPFSDAELEEFRALIEEKRAAALGDLEDMRQQVAAAREGDTDGAYSFHMADSGTDAMELEKLYHQIARMQKHIGYLERATERIDAGTYGVCKVTGKPIAKERLRAVPHTELSMEAKLQQK